MSKLILLPALLVCALGAHAQEPRKPEAKSQVQDQAQQQPAKKLDPQQAREAAEAQEQQDRQDRIRTEGAAGGTHPIGERARRGADTQAGPHLKRDPGMSQ